MSGEGDIQREDQISKEGEGVEGNNTQTDASLSSGTSTPKPESTSADPSGEKEKTTETTSDAKEKKSSSSGKSQLSKIELRLQPTGDAPIMKKRKWVVDPQKTVGQINKFVREYIKLDEKENLFMYVNQAFAPSPDQTLNNLYECFGSDGNLVLHYSKNQAWG